MSALEGKLPLGMLLALPARISLSNNQKTNLHRETVTLSGAIHLIRVVIQSIRMNLPFLCQPERHSLLLIPSPLPLTTYARRYR